MQDLGRNERAGIDVAAVLEELMAVHPKIQSLVVYEQETPPLIDGRATLSSEEQEVVRRGLRLGGEIGLPFWDSVLLSCFSQAVPVRGLLAAASYHNPTRRTTTELKRAAVNEKEIRRVARSASTNKIMMVSSLVACSGHMRRHIPMLDFRCPESKENLGLVKAVVSGMGMGGFLLRSGHSYHFYGDFLLEKSRLVHFLARALQYSPIVDRAWIAHQLLEGACALRISPKEHGGDMPSVVARVKAI